MSFIVGLGVGSLLGAVGHYYFQQYSLDNKRTTFTHGGQIELSALFEEFPNLMDLFKRKISDKEYSSIREFFVVDPLAIMNTSQLRLRFDLSDELLSLLEKLEGLELIYQLEHDSLLYCMTEEFVSQLIEYSQPNVPSQYPQGECVKL